MKYLIILMLVTATYSSEFCTGWARGWLNGYCYDKTYCIRPIRPMCPHVDDLTLAYSYGYNRGFFAGKTQAGRENRQEDSVYEFSITVVAKTKDEALKILPKLKDYHTYDLIDVREPIKQEEIWQE